MDDLKINTLTKELLMKDKKFIHNFTGGVGDEEELFTMLAEYLSVLHETMEAWDNFAMKKLYLYIIQ